jgi:hypothetical protein
MGFKEPQHARPTCSGVARAEVGRHLERIDILRSLGSKLRKPSMNIAQATLIVALAQALAAPGSAEVIPLSVSMDGAQANAGAGTGSAGTGVASLTFDTNTKILTWSISWAGLTGAPTLMHFHGPAPPDQSAPALLSTGVIGPPVVGNAMLSAGYEANLLAGLWYLNLHTSTSPGGEIRGQVQVVRPLPSMGVVGMIGLAGLIAVAASRMIVIASAGPTGRVG